MREYSDKEVVQEMRMAKSNPQKYFENNFNCNDGQNWTLFFDNETEMVHKALFGKVKE